ncbi:MAG TPA: STAS domain-containing protein [Mycobacteriales bacterium]|nr:STAS domain-containing protein [Mycobacteriales bacterium]
MSRDIEIESGGPVVIAVLSGELDLASTPAVSAKVLDAVTVDTAGLVVDLSGVRYIDSSGVHMLFDFARRLEAGRQGMAIALGATSPIRGLLEITHISQAVAVCSTREDAMSSAAEGAQRSY